MKAKIIGAAILVATSLLAGCENKQSTNSQSTNSTAIGEEACHTQLTLVHQNEALDAEESNKDTAQMVAEYGENGMLSQVNGRMLLERLEKLRKPVSGNQTQECVRKARLDSYNKFLAEARSKLKEKK